MLVKRSMITGLDRLVSASRAIFVVAICVAVIGFAGCICTGLEPFGLNYFQHGAIGAAIGFCLGAVGVAVGGRRGWALAGALWGVCIALFLAASMPRNNPKHTDSCGMTIFSVFICAAIGLGIAGNWLGKQFSSQLELASNRSCGRGSIAKILHESGLYERPLVLRLALALLQAVPVLITAPSLVRRLAGY